MIYHLLPATESFSMFSGLALARDVANIMRFDDSAIVVCRKRPFLGFPCRSYPRYSPDAHIRTNKQKIYSSSGSRRRSFGGFLGPCLRY